MDLDELRTQLIANTFPGMIPLLAAAQLLGVTKAGLLKKIRTGTADLDMVTIALDDSETQLRGVTPASLSKVLREEADALTVLEARALTRLRELAAAKQTEEYAPFMERLGMTWRNPHHRNLIGKVLGALSERICDKRRDEGEAPIAVSVLVVTKATGMPGDSFFGFAEHHLDIPSARKVSPGVAFARLKKAVFDSAGTW